MRRSLPQLARQAFAWTKQDQYDHYRRKFWTVSAATSLTFIATLVSTRTRLDKEADTTQKNLSNEDVIEPHQQIPIDFFERLAHKPYLHVPGLERPPKVPRTLRLLIVDLPAVHERGFANGTCQQRLDKLYPNGVARNLELPPHDDKKSTRSSKSLEIQQKTWVKAFFECRRSNNAPSSKKDGTPDDDDDDDDKVHVEIMQASMLGLNPHNMARRIHAPFVVGAARTATHRPTVAPSSSNTTTDTATTAIEKATQQTEQDAPWNQHAWMEEVRLRLQGQVAFGAPLQRAWRRRRYYRSKWWWWRPSSEDDKPHAVIANGTTLQRVPNALRLLQITCHENNIPLLVVHDPRKWGGNTHENLGLLMQDLRKTLKRRIVTASLQYSAGRAFQHGRLLGRLETNAAWYYARHQAMAKKRDGGDDDWSSWEALALEEELMRHGVITFDDVSTTKRKKYSPGFVALAKQCVVNEQKETADAANPPLETDEESPTEAPL